MIKVGNKIKIIRMSHMSQYNGRTGIIQSIENNCRLFGTWGELPINLDLDCVEFLD